MAINFSPKVGQVLECDFGSHGGNITDKNGHVVPDPSGHIPPEMVKNRLVVVLNGKIGGCIVVPLSTTYDDFKTKKGMHVLVSGNCIPQLNYFGQDGQKDRWAKADMVQQVSKDRLQRPRVNRDFVEVFLSSVMVADIQRAVIKSINATSLLITTTDPTNKV